MTDISTLFSTDPLKLTRELKLELIEQLRSMRHQFNSGNLQAGKTKKKETDPTVDLGSLGL